MRLVRHCHEKLPGGPKLWRRLARMAGYDGLVEVRGFGSDGQIPRRTKDGKGTITLGYTVVLANTIPVKIVVYLGPPYAKCARWYPENTHPLFTFAHELGHAWAATHGKRVRGSAFKTYAEWKAMKSEQWANRFAERLLRRAGIGQEGRTSNRRPVRSLGSLSPRPSSY